MVNMVNWDNASLGGPAHALLLLFDDSLMPFPSIKTIFLLHHVSLVVHILTMVRNLIFIFRGSSHRYIYSYHEVNGAYPSVQQCSMFPSNKACLNLWPAWCSIWWIIQVKLVNDDHEQPQDLKLSKLYFFYQHIPGWLFTKVWPAKFSKSLLKETVPKYYNYTLNLSDLLVI